MTVNSMVASATKPCGCSSVSVDTPGCCTSRDLDADPFLALRVAYGMLLGEEDFRVLMANPRGKQHLHSSWLHGRGAVWGLRVREYGDEIQVLPGLAIDGVGRELRIGDGGWCVTTRDWATDWLRDHPGTVDKEKEGDCATHVLDAWVVAEFGCCLDRAVPTLADPCDVTRTQSGPSRIIESARISLVAEPPCDHADYRRVRMLLGIEELSDDELGEEARAGIDEVTQADGDERARVLLAWFRRLAARDEMDLVPRSCDGDAYRSWTPVTEECSPVVLAHLTVRVRVEGGCVTVDEVCVDNDVRQALLPTATISDLLCGFAPGVLGVSTQKDAGGPRLLPDSLEWTGDRTRLSFSVDRKLAVGSTEGAITVTSLSDRGLGWATEDIERIALADDDQTVRVYFDRPPKYETVRIIIHGTGPRPLFGADPAVPFAGIVGGPPGTADDGHDAVVTQHLTASAATSSRRSAS
jgi:hypothetical protein